MNRLETIQSGGGGVGGVVARLGLRALSGPYWLAGRLRALVYGVGIRRTRRLPVPVLAIGNIAVGGTGKTPFVAWLAAALRADGRHPGILSRGYGPRAPGAEGLSDEGAVLRHVLGGELPMREQPDRFQGGRALLGRHPEVDVLLLDDGFQQRRLAPDLQIVLLDATCPFGHGHLLPRGRLREGPRALRRADLVGITRGERLADDALGLIRGVVASYTDAPVFQVRTVPRALEVDGREEPASALQGRKVLAACGLGNPAAFLSFLEDCGATVVASRLFADHATILESEIPRLVAEAHTAGADWVVMTRKDAVKHATLPADVAVLDVGIEITHGEADLREAVARVLARRS